MAGTISFKVTKTEALIIGRIVNRAISLAKEGGHDLDAMSLDMDITAAHANGCELDLNRLLAADDFNFVHDVFGIRRHIDRKTGQLTDCFLPRFAISQ